MVPSLTSVAAAANPIRVAGTFTTIFGPERGEAVRGVEDRGRALAPGLEEDLASTILVPAGIEARQVGDGAATALEDGGVGGHTGDEPVGEQRGHLIDIGAVGIETDVSGHG